MHILQQNYSLKSLNTFGIDAKAKYYLTFTIAEDFAQFFDQYPSFKLEKKLFLGAGSNLLFVTDFDGLIVHPKIEGIKCIKDDGNNVDLEVGAGVNWDYFVNYCVENEYYGVENLSLIPGNIGAVPVQNIGAYGVEASALVYQVNGIRLDTLQSKSINGIDCEFDYRTSLFKEKLKDNFLVTSVIFRLSKQPNFKIQYEGLVDKIAQFGPLNIQNIRKAIIAIRQSKLPDPAVLGNAGSFFKNPIVTESQSIALRQQYSDIPLYPFKPGLVKVAAGWLIEKAGWKGKSLGNAAVHDRQALVLINKGEATGEEIFQLSQTIAADVRSKFGIALEREVQLVKED
jgi:UDP-N-acetylmuramate dehydrogenase